MSKSGRRFSSIVFKGTPSNPTDGEIWYDATSNTFKFRQNSSVVNLNSFVAPPFVAADFAASAGVATLVRQTFLSSGSWAKPSALLGDLIFLRGFGGGGGGAGGSSPSGTSGGGGSGSVERTIMLKLAPSSTSFSVTVGAGGSAGTVGSNGGAGGDSVFTDSTASVELYRWKGGPGGIIGAGSGSSSFSDLNSLRNVSIPGGAGGVSNTNGNGSAYINPFAQSKPFSGGVSINYPGNGRGGGGGGAGPEGNGGNGGGTDATPNGFPASANSGAGGGGGGSVVFSSSFNGAAGGSGLVELWYWANVKLL